MNLSKKKKKKSKKSKIIIYEQFLAQFTDWRPTTLYWQRFSIAEKYGKEEVKRVYNEIFAESKKDYKLLTELVMILNHKSWEHCEDIDCSDFCNIYSDLFMTAKEYAENHLEGDELRYFLDTTD